MTRTLNTEEIIVSRKGRVRIRSARPSNAAAHLGLVKRDPKNPRRWVAQNIFGRRVTRRPLPTRQDAVVQLAEQVVLDPVPAEEHQAFTGPIDIIPSDAHRTIWSSMTMLERTFSVLAVPLGLLGMGLLALAPSLM